MHKNKNVSEKVSWSWFPRPIPPSPDGNARPVFITGIPRCGSSWVGEILGNSVGTRYVYEPFNFQWMPALRDQVRHFRYLSDQSEFPEILQAVSNGAFDGRQGWKQLGRAVYRGYLKAACRKATRVVIKDPTASLKAAWIASHYKAQILIVIRHPCGFASSIDSLNWPLNVNVILGQKTLMSDHLEPFRDTMRRARNDKWLTRGAIWGAVHTVFAHQLEQYTDWHLCKYEDLCNDPQKQFSNLAKELGLETGKQTRDRISALSTSSGTNSGSTRRKSTVMPEIWRNRMSAGQIDAVNGIVREFGLEYYLN